MDSHNLQEFIDEHQVDARIIPLDKHTLTVGDAAKALSVSTDQIIKSLVFHVNKEPLLVINNGLARVDRRKLAAYLAVGRKKVKFASPDTAFTLTGYVVGSMPPFGHKQTLRTIVDNAVAAMDVIYGGGGDIDTMMRLTPQALLTVTQAELVPLSE